MNKHDLATLFKGPKAYAYHTGSIMKDYSRSMKGPRKKRFHKLADEFLENMLNWFSPKDVVKIIKVWISHYNISLDVDLLKNGDRMHSTVGGLITTMPIEEIEEFI